MPSDSKLIPFLALSFFLWFRLANPQVLNPPYFNIAEGRNITASATCGEGVPEPELYCKIVGSNWLDESDNVNLIEGQACDYCDPNDPKRAHPPHYAIDGTEQWWQSPPLSRGPQYSKVNLTLDLGQEFNVAYVFIKMGNSPRPGVWILERSRDHGKTFTPWQYFADTPQDCSYYFGKHTLQPITSDDSVICETKFSKLVPLENGEIAISLINGRPSADNFSSSQKLQEWTTATNIRLVFLRPKTTLGHLLSVAREEPTVTRRYFYSVKDINIGGQCVCNGHASQCDQNSASDPWKLSCACQHHTCGSQCEECCDGYQQYEWRRATVEDPFVCEKCNCHGHSNECYFDPEVAAKNQSKNIHGKYIGGGHCKNCQHNTTGINCDRCLDGFFRPQDKLLDAIDVCQPCKCDLKFSTGNCFDETGQCECRENYKSPNCDDCNIGYFGFPECQECHCFPNGTQNNLCELTEGDCPCKEGYGGKYCKECKPGFYGFPECKPCNCNPTNSRDNICDSITGNCSCLSNYGSRDCSECNLGHYNYPQCQSCLCNQEGSNETICSQTTGNCYCLEGYEFPFCDRCSDGYYGFPNCTKCDCNDEGSINKICDNMGKCPCKANFGGLKCNDCGVGYFNYPKCEQCKCHWRGSTGISCDHSGNCLCSDRYEGQKCDQCKEGYYNFPNCEECNCNPAGLVAEFGGCDKVEIGKLCECKERVKGRICNQCKDLYWNLQMNNPYGCEECHCNRNGTTSHIGICDTVTGKCKCKPNVQGRTCSVCKPNTYQLDAANLFGCVDCGCDIGGAISSDCDKFTGQCRCKSRIKGKTCSETFEATYFPSFYQFLYETEDWQNPTGSRARFGYDENIFPNHSWRGYAVFNPLQKQISTNITITKTSIYKIIIHYINKNSEVVNGELKFTPNEWMNEEVQSVSIPMEPTNQPKSLYVTGRQMNGVISLGVGPWHVSLKVDKFDLFVDYIVLIPQAYYDPTLFQERKTGPCLYFPSNNLSCILHRYPKYPNDSKHYPAIEAFVVKDSGQNSPAILESPEYQEKLKDQTKFVQLEEENPNLEFEFVAESNGTNLMILNYHTPGNLNLSIPIHVKLENLNKNQTFESRNILSACPYLFVCRQAITTDEGRLMTFDAMAEDPFRLRINLGDVPNSDQEPRLVTRQIPSDSVLVGIDPNKTININKITVTPFDNRWSYDYIEPSFVCIFKNGACTPSTFPVASEGIKIEAEKDQNPDYVMEMPGYIPINTPSGIPDVAPLVVQLNESMPSIDIRGSVPKPGPYYFVLSYHRPDNPRNDFDTLIQNGHLYSSIASLNHCPNNVGCRTVLKQRDSNMNSTAFNIQDNFMFSMKVPANETVHLDYLLVIPAETFDEQILTPEPMDGSKNIMSECIKNNYFIDPNNSSDHCRSLAFSTTVDFNGGALPCDCNIDGSYDYKCENFGGQCKCKPNVIGRDCSLCKTGYYGFPNCKKCDCPSTAICHAKTGDCICPKGVTGKDCDKCIPLTFGFDKIIGCEDCDCNPRGVLNRDLRCDLETGDCSCKQNIVGRTCDKCRPGFFGFPNCQLCRCDIRGTTPEICDQSSARCFCKKNVDGAFCDRCKTDSYFLEENNVQGCTKCFCFGNTDRCTGSSFVFVPISLLNRELDLYNLTISDNLLDIVRLKKNEDYQLDYVDNKFVIATSFARDSKSDISNKIDSSGIYILLPKEYLGKKISSYGGKFQYTFANKIINSKDYEPASPMPDIILVGRNYTLIHEHVEQPIINENFTIDIRLLENEFKRLDGTHVTREQLMMTLVDLHAIYVRVKYFDSLQDSIDIELQFQMETASPGNKNTDLMKAAPANSVEQCLCPPNYRGTSCEECAEGYYRIQHGTYLGACVPCNCNGHSNECDAVTGKCFNCKYNTEGDHCERCTQGFYGDATQGTPNDCLICACPLPIESNNFATSCEVSSSGSVLSCNCKDGYTGTRCEICGAGHYGQPQIMGQTCQKCECNDNIDVTDMESCDAFTGNCMKCLFNSSGPHCERCADWHYGDSIVSKNCSECSCNKCGSEYCDHKTAICKCKPNVIGKNCDQCAPGFYGYSTCNGCQPCNCGEASHEMNCDDSGQCPCKTGVEGKTCSTCAPGYWGYSKYGCTSCGCDEKYSRVKQCNQFTGQCQCLPGVIGAKCEKCPDRWVLVQESGCQECGDCIHTLLDDADQIAENIESIISQTKNTSSSKLTDRKLNYEKARMNRLSEMVDTAFEETEERKNFRKVKKDSEELLDNIEKIDIKADSLEKNSEKVLAKVNKAYNDSINAENRVKAIRQMTVQVVESINQLESGLSEASVNHRGSIEESEQILNDLKKPFIDDVMRQYDIDLTTFSNTLESANNFYKSWIEMKEEIDTASNRKNNMSDLVNELKNLTTAAREDTFDAERIIQKGLKDSLLNQIESLKLMQNDTVSAMQDAQQSIEKAKENIDVLENMKIDIEQQDNRLGDEMNRLNSTLDELVNSLPDLEKDVSEAENHAREQMLQSRYLHELMSSTNNQATDPLRAAHAYDNISKAIEDGEKVLQDIQQIINDNEAISLNEIKPLNVQEVLDKSLNASNHLQNQEMTIDEIDRIMKEKEEQFRNLNQSFSNLDPMDDKKSMHADITKRLDDVFDTERKINQILESIENLKGKSKDIKDYSEFVNDVKEGKDYVDRFHKDVERIKNISTSDDINDLNNEFSKMKSSISNKINDLKKRIQLARHQANNMRVGVEFFGEGSHLELNNPPNLVESSTYNKFSMRFQERYPDGLLAFIGNPIDGTVPNDIVKRQAPPTVGSDPDEVSKAKRKSINYDYMALELVRGKVVLIWELGASNPTIIQDKQFINDGKWHQIIVERFGRLIRLTVITDRTSTVTERIASGSASVFNLNRDQSKIFIGGVPPNIQLNRKVINRFFYGTISNVLLDNEPLGLWNAKDSSNIQGAPAYELFTENTLRFNGNSYVILGKNDLDFKETIFVSLQFKTFSKNGLLFLVGDPIKKTYFAIELTDGLVYVKYDFGSAVSSVVSNNYYNDGQWHFIKVNREEKESLLNVDDRDEQSGFSMGLSTDLFTDDNIYVGGFRGMHPYYDVTKEGFDGCIKDLQIDSTQQNLNNHKESFGVTQGCSTFVRVVSFSEYAKSSYVEFKDQAIDANQQTGMNDLIQITFKFRTLSKIGLLMQWTDSNYETFVKIYLMEGMLNLKMSNNIFLQTDNQYYNDNKWHFITVSFNQRSLEMDVDDLNAFSLVIDTPIDINRLTTIYIGGLPIEDSEFTGCIGDVTLNYKYLNFADSNQTKNVQFKKCLLAQNEDEFSLPNFKDIIVPETFTKAPSIEYLPPIGDCKLPPIPLLDSSSLDPEEKRFGNTLWSRYEFTITNEVTKALELESGFQLKFKTFQAEGILFYMTSTNNIDFVGLYFLNNKLHYSFDCGSGRGVAVSPHSYNDNKWHSVTFSRKEKNGLLRVDDEVFEVSSTGTTTSLNVRSPIYLGGVPKELRSQIKSHLKSADKSDYNYAMTSFSGCIRDLKVRDLEYKFSNGREFDVAPCSNQAEYGHFFHYDGGFIRLFDEFRVRIEFALILEIKPRKPDGILAAVFGERDFLVLYMDKGTLFFSVDNGAVPITTSDNATNGICDGKWHTIKAIKNKNLVMLNVDDKAAISTGQPGISSTDTKDPLYIGGIPEKLKEEKSSQLNNVKDNYSGCLRIKSINGMSQTLNNAKIEGHITLNSCSVV